MPSGDAFPVLDPRGFYSTSGACSVSPFTTMVSGEGSARREPEVAFALPLRRVLKTIERRPVPRSPIAAPVSICPPAPRARRGDHWPISERICPRKPARARSGRDARRSETRHHHRTSRNSGGHDCGRARGLLQRRLSRPPRSVPSTRVCPAGDRNIRKASAVRTFRPTDRGSGSWR
jgi:hypothetical protein